MTSVSATKIGVRGRSADSTRGISERVTATIKRVAVVSERQPPRRVARVQRRALDDGRDVLIAPPCPVDAFGFADDGIIDRSGIQSTAVSPAACGVHRHRRIRRIAHFCAWGAARSHGLEHLRDDRIPGCVPCRISF
jgi:hypothetical protein